MTGFDTDQYHEVIEKRGKRGDGEEMSAEQLSQVASRLREFATTMVENVDAHQNRVQAVSEELQEVGDASSEVVLAAVSQLIHSNESMQNQLQSAKDRIQQQTMQIESAERRAETDALTQVPNRRAFDAYLKRRHAEGPGAAGTLALLDVDLFKQFNDVYGHRAGDEVLRVVANVLHSHLQPYGLVARFGGEEFAIILDECPISEAALKIEQARVAIGQLVIEFEGQPLRVAASAGVATLMEEEKVESWLQRTDDALYHSKGEGRNCAHRMQGKKPTLITLSPEDVSVANAEMLTIGDSESGDDSSEGPVLRRIEGNGVFASLANRSSLEKSFNDIRSRTKESVSVHLMVVMCAPGLGNSSIRSILQVVRMPLRSVDRIGAIDDSTLLVCMPSADAELARQRGGQICHSIMSLGIKTLDDQVAPVRVGLAEATVGEEFNRIVSRALQEAVSQGDGTESAESSV
ncbi:GGDEF domain-containing protein [Rubripirellula sp.]|nr:GGDEF domain-containing protein [Rubripirellula sp.]